MMNKTTILRTVATNTAACFRCTSNHKSSYVRSMTIMTQYATTTKNHPMNAIDCRNNYSHYSYCRHPQHKKCQHQQHQHRQLNSNTNTNYKGNKHTNNNDKKQEPVAIIEEKGTDQEQDQKQKIEQKQKQDHKMRIQVAEQEQQDEPITDFSDISRAMVAIRDGIRRTTCIKSYFLSELCQATIHRCMQPCTFMVYIFNTGTHFT
jgi:hypothetical protein